MEKKQLPVLPGLVHEPAGPDERPYLQGSKCKTCGRVFFPRVHVCSTCMSPDTMESIALSGRGTIDTFSVVHVAPMGFKAPYIQAFINLPEGPRIFSLITGCDPLGNDLRDGAPVELVIDKIREDEKGNDLIGYKFRPIGK
jgi:uncharacterized protein